MNRPVRREGFQHDAPPEAQRQQIEPPPRSAERWPMVIPLAYSQLHDPSKPEPIRELSLRQPTGADINACGSPVVMNSEGTRFTMEDRRMHHMIARLAGILTPILDPIDPRDWQTVAWRLYRFFLPTPAAWDD